MPPCSLILQIQGEFKGSVAYILKQLSYCAFSAEENTSAQQTFEGIFPAGKISG